MLRLRNTDARARVAGSVSIPGRGSAQSSLEWLRVEPVGPKLQPGGVNLDVRSAGPRQTLLQGRMNWVLPTGHGKPVPHSTSAADRPLTLDEKLELLRAARQALVNHLQGGEPIAGASESPVLRRVRSTFVTLRRRDTGELRGCRGDCTARHPLLSSVMRMAIASGTGDSRFPPVTLEEVPSLAIEISVLGEFFPVEVDAIEVGRHGLLIVRGPTLGILLPQVPLAYGWDRKAFLRALCSKADLPDNAWTDPAARLFAFETEWWSESSLAPGG